MDPDDNPGWTSCEMFGHLYELNGEPTDTCVDCGRSREDDDD